MIRTKGVRALLAITVLAGALMLGVLASPAQAALRHVDGTVLSKDAGAKTFRITTQGGSQIRVKVNAGTVFERIAGGFGGLRKGMQIEVDGVQTNNGLLARKVEPQGGRGGGGGGGDHGGGSGGGGSDDGPNHT
jgi:uncharacterized membrane protein YgcG